jgi:alpha-L-fucosidase
MLRYPAPEPSHGEGIYDTRPWHWFGEGPTLFEEGAFRDMEQVSFTFRDFRFTYKAETLYAFVIQYPQTEK